MYLHEILLLDFVGLSPLLNALDGFGNSKLFNATGDHPKHPFQFYQKQSTKDEWSHTPAPPAFGLTGIRLSNFIQRSLKRKKGKLMYRRAYKSPLTP